LASVARAGFLFNTGKKRNVLRKWHATPKVAHHPSRGRGTYLSYCVLSLGIYEI
jgi:hypothetical protein